MSFSELIQRFVRGSVVCAMQVSSTPRGICIQFPLEIHHGLRQRSHLPRHEIPRILVSTHSTCHPVSMLTSTEHMNIPEIFAEYIVRKLHLSFSALANSKHILDALLERLLNPSEIWPVGPPNSVIRLQT